MLSALLHRVVSNPWVYDGVQELAGRDRNYKALAPHLAEASGMTPLDLGAGTGDRGSHPRRPEALRAVMAEWFAIEREERYSIYHHYWLAAGRPKAARS